MSRSVIDEPTPPRTVARHGRLTRRSAVRGIFGLLAAVVVVALVSSVGVAAYAVWDIASAVKPGIHLSHQNGSNTTSIPQIAAISGGVNMLLVGSDTRTDQGGQYATKSELAGSSGYGNNDVTILIHIAQDHQSATVVSFPRDTILPIPSCPNPKGGSYGASSAGMLNSSLSHGGLACPVLTIEKLTGLTIPFAAEITFDGVAAMSNAVGGVSVCIATPISDPYVGLTLAAGEQTLQGTQALAFLRSRHGVGDGSDLGRISSQQVFLSALVRKIEAAGTLSNPIELFSLAKAAVDNMQLSDTLESPTTMVQIALALKGVPLSSIVFLQYPTVSDPTNANRVVPDSQLGEVLDQALQADQPVSLTGQPGRAAQLATTAPTASGTATATATAAPNADGSSPVALPSGITGQTANEQTCAKGNTVRK